MKRISLFAALLALALAGCSGKPLDPDQISGQADEIPPGRGLVSGDKGAFEAGF